MKFTVRERKTNEDMSYFYRSCFETAKNTDAIQYTSLKKKHPEKSEEEIFQLFRQEIDDSFDFDREDCKIYFIETNEGGIGGYVWVALRDSEDPWDLERPLWIFDINVHPDFRRRGLGRRLLREAEGFARGMNRNIGLFVHTQNSAAISLYESEGYMTKAVPVSATLEKKDRVYREPSGYTVRKASDKDSKIVLSMSLDSFRRLVRFSFNASDDSISQRYHELLKKYSRKDDSHTKYVVATPEQSIIAFLWVGVADFSDKYGLMYHHAIAERHKTPEVESLMISVFKKWSYEKDLARAYILYHSRNDISRESLTRAGFANPGLFLEKRLKT